jgi:3'-5' exonuclease
VFGAKATTGLLPRRLLQQNRRKADIGNGVSAPGLHARSYFHRYTEDAIDLCDVFSSFSPQGKASLHEISRVMGLPGKPKGFDGGEVERYFREGKIKEIAEYCESDVVNAYRLWLRYDLFRGRLADAGFQASEASLVEFIKVRANSKPHLPSCNGPSNA